MKDWTWREWLDVLAVGFIGFYALFLMVEQVA